MTFTFPIVGKPINDSPLALVLPERKAAGAMRRKRKCEEVPSSPSKPGLDRAKMGTSSQGPSKKKPPMETRRNMERKTQQEWQEAPAFDITDVQDQDSTCGDSLAGQIIPPLQQNNPPPPKGPTEPGTSGFFGFLSPGPRAALRQKGSRKQQLSEDHTSERSWISQVGLL
ncbi:PREDICTED: uncharacterized protein C11orf85 homolog isoform X1 [Ceratotherium simum simum]|uniref:Uncharacterized protein C11orf85 homolog isoform X1 n=1 Tax=Ceratotherium simum simum TaxID=73337 RepID=A0ABM1D9J5_CERSS|nr:PREDICTED: uncharacterized protein C11orf85 homolog isoform X1 [Ceratotherium simum simum]